MSAGAFPRRELTQDEADFLNAKRREDMQMVATIQKGEIWEIGPFRYKVVKSLAGGKIVHLRRLQGAPR